MSKYTELIIKIAFIIIFMAPLIVWALRGVLHTFREDALRINGIKTSAVVKEFNLGVRRKIIDFAERIVSGDMNSSLNS
ncbi:MAG: hypothetical protein FWG14_01615 [Peptococcaceae bacterium]|nr:hypothetical protein [Peptococcaceae bacterium]